MYIDTLCACLAYDPAERITAEDLLKRCQGVTAIYDEQTAGDPVVADSLTSRNTNLFNILPNRPNDPKFQLQLQKRAVAQFMGNDTPPIITRIDSPTPDGPYLPDLLFPRAPIADRPTLATYFQAI